MCGLSFGVGGPDPPPAGWGFSYMDHMGANIMAVAILAAVAHRNRTGEGQWVDMSCTDAGLGLTGPDLLDYTVNSRPLRRAGMPDSNHSDQPAMAPHGIYPTERGPLGRHRLPGRPDWVNSVRCAESRGPGRSVRDGVRPAWRDRTSSTTWSPAWTSGAAGTRSPPGSCRRGASSTVAMSEDRIDHDADNAAWGCSPRPTTP